VGVPSGGKVGSVVDITVFIPRNSQATTFKPIFQSVRLAWGVFFPFQLNKMLLSLPFMLSSQFSSSLILYGTFWLGLKTLALRLNFDWLSERRLLPLVRGEFWTEGAALPPLGISSHEYQRG
jgi:hypothetical protein